jgi:protein TonB
MLLGVVAHLVLGALIAAVPQKKRFEAVAIQMAEEKKKKEEKKDEEKPKPPPPKPAEKAPSPEPAQVIPQEAVAPPPTAAPQAAPGPVVGGPALDGFADLGGGSGGGGFALPTGGGGPAKAASAAPKPVQKSEHAAPLTSEKSCSEPARKPKRITGPSPKPTEAASAAEVEGVVKVQVTVDITGHVTDAKVIQGLGYGLDERALEAARAWTFEPAVECGAIVVGTVVLPFRFELEK